MMYAVQQEMECQEGTLVRKIVIHMEQESMQGVFENCPNQITREETKHGFGKCRARDRTKELEWCKRVLGESRQSRRDGELHQRTDEKICGDREPESGHHIPNSPGKHLGIASAGAD